MYILGLNHGEINSSAALLKNSKIIAASGEERFSRNKKTKVFPQNAINFCLETAEIDLTRCECIAQGWNPAEYWKFFNYSSISDSRVRREDYLFSLPDNLFKIIPRDIPDWLLLDSAKNSPLPPVYFVKHHLAHAANAFFLSPYKESAILTCDWRGEFETTSIGKGNENTIEIFSVNEMPHSLGMFYATFTELLGYRRDNDEWKVMALSAFDIDADDYFEKIMTTIQLKDNGFFELDPNYYQGPNLSSPDLLSKNLIDLLGGRVGKKDEEPDEWHYKVANAMQKVAEKITFNLINFLYEKTKSENLVLSGGFFMNSVLNGKITSNSKFKNIYISYAPDDLGNSMGAALYVNHVILNQKRDTTFNSSYLGSKFSDNDIHEFLNDQNISFEKLNERNKIIAKLLSEKNVIAIFEGKSEFGERALGNRSILADPRDENMKDKINSVIKYRESYRPFAPSVKFEDADKYFEVPAGYECFFMEKVIPVKISYREKLPAITHVDGSARLHTVKKEHNPLFYDLLNEFEKISKYPILLNTSFNLNGEPIVNTPQDALNTFSNSNLDYLLLQNYLITKN
tara:strand:+ start:8960 stop:10672 length:1713 start_codon:yes stop_codon:yes gene_type:complete